MFKKMKLSTKYECFVDNNNVYLKTIFMPTLSSF